MRSMRCVAAILACLLLAAPLRAQKNKREPLTDAQIDQIRDAGIDPNQRVVSTRNSWTMMRRRSRS